MTTVLKRERSIVKKKNPSEELKYKKVIIVWFLAIRAMKHLNRKLRLFQNDCQYETVKIKIFRTQGLFEISGHVYK